MAGRTPFIYFFIIKGYFRFSFELLVEYLICLCIGIIHLKSLKLFCIRKIGFNMLYKRLMISILKKKKKSVSINASALYDSFSINCNWFIYQSVNS